MSTTILTTRYSKYYRRRSAGRVLLVGLICLGVVALAAKLVSANPLGGVSLVAIVLLVVAICRWPLFGYLTAVSILLPCEIFANPDGISPFTILPFTNLNIFTPISLSITPLELVLVLTGLVTFVKTSIKGKVFLDRGFQAKIVGVLMGFVLLGYIWGVYIRHGDSKVAQVEVRAMVYVPVIYFLTVYFMKDTNLWKVFNWIFPVGLTLLSALVAWRFFVLTDAPGETFYKESLNGYNHDTAILLVILLIWCSSKLVFGGSRLEKFVAFALISPAVFGIFVSNRRAAFAVLAVVMVMLLGMLYVRRRNAFIVTVIILAIIVPPYTIAFSKASGPLGSAARAFSSSDSTPGSRDYNSDLYRLVEKSNVQLTIKDSPLLGIGFGQPFTQYIYFLNLEGFEFQYYTPHVQVLWLWLKLGMFGWATFWFLICLTLFKLGQVVKYDRYGVRMSMCIVAGSIITGLMVYAYLDVSLVNTRLMSLLAVSIGMIEVGYQAVLKNRRATTQNPLIKSSPTPPQRLVGLK